MNKTYHIHIGSMPVTDKTAEILYIFHEGPAVPITQLLQCHRELRGMELLGQKPLMQLGHIYG